MRISARVDYAIRAMSEMAVADRALTAQEIATAQDLPLRYLVDILTDLRRNRLVQSQRGPDGGYLLSRPATELTLADVFRALDGPLAEVHDLSLTTLEYEGPSAELRTVWMAVRASLRRVLERVTIADVASGRLSDDVQALADEYAAAIVSHPPAGRASNARH